MNTDLFKTMAEAAGIGGMALGVLMVLFRNIIRKSIFPTLKEEHAYQLLQLITFLIFAISIAGIGAWVWAANFAKPQTKATFTANPSVVDISPPPKVGANQGVAAGRDIHVGGDIIIGGEKQKK
jgi:hypothetical protein